MKKHLLERLPVLALSVALILSLTPSAAFGAGISGSCGAGVTWSFDAVSGALTISGRGNMDDYSYYSPAPWANRYMEIRSVTVNEGVTSIGSYAFYEGRRESEYLNLRTLSLPSTLRSVGSYAFYECSALNSLDLPAGLTAVGEYAFGDCSALRTVTGGESLTAPGRYAFSDCGLLNGFTLAEGLTAIPDGLFEDCESLRAVTLPKGLTSIGAEAFEGCALLGGAELPEGLTYIGDKAFEGCVSLLEITIPFTVTYLGRGAFEECTGLTSISYNAADAEVGAYYFGEYEPPFADCRSVSSLIVGGGVHKIKAYTFAGLRSLSSVTLGTSVNEIGERAFYGCYLIKDIYYDGSAADWDRINTAYGNESLMRAQIHYSGGESVPSVPSKARLTVGRVTGRPGANVTVPVSVSDNPGIATFALQIDFDKTRLTPISAVMGPTLTAGSLVSNIDQGADMNRYDFVSSYWVNPSNVSGNGVILELTFRIADTAPEGDVPLTVTLKPGDVANQHREDVELDVTDGAVEVRTALMGDVNSDGKVNSKDGLKLSQHLARWNVPMTAAELAAADVEKDGEVNSKDGLKLSQYLARWDVSIQSAVSPMTAGGRIAFAVDSVSGSAGDYVDVPVRITANTGAATFYLELHYDKTALTPVLITKGSALTDGSLTSNIQQDGGDYDFVTAYWVNPANVSAEGVAFTVRFKVADGASGSLPVNLEYYENDPPLTQGFEELRVETVGGVVTLEGPTSGGGDYTVNSLTAESTGSTVRLKAQTTKNSAISGEDAFVIAMYKNNVLMDMLFIEAEFAQGQTVSLGGMMAYVPGAVYKAFVWDSLDSMTSLSNTAEKQL